MIRGEELDTFQGSRRPENAALPMGSGTSRWYQFRFRGSYSCIVLWDAHELAAPLWSFGGTSGL